MAGKKDAKQKAISVAKQRRTKGRPRFPQGRRTPPRGAGREQPKAHSSGHRKKKNCRGTLKNRGSPRSQA
jgi:hypothetical protein